MTKIIYTKVDESPELASGSLLPIVRAFTQAAGIEVDTRNISLAGRILASFPDSLSEDQKQADHLADLGQVVTNANANIVKLPNISASVPQLKAAIKELQENGFAIPDYPDEPSSDAEREIQATYAKVMGSAVNPVLRQGNSDRRAPKAVKEYARKNPHFMGEWAPESKTHVATMQGGDFFTNEKSTTITEAQAGDGRVEFVAEDGAVTVLKESMPLHVGQILDATFLSAKALRAFLEAHVADAREQGVLFSVHLKATMMKVSDPVMFGHVVAVFFKDLLEKHADALKDIGFNPNNGLGDLLSRIESLPDDQRAAIEADIKACMDAGPDLFMVNSERGITNLHVPSDVIVDASMPALIRAGGKGWGPDGKQHDTKCVIPDYCYAPIYQETIRFCKVHGAFDPATMGTVSNVGLMADKAEEYGSHTMTFIAPGDGVIRITDPAGETVHAHDVEEGDIWRACMAEDEPIRDWVKLAVARARATGDPAVFWLNHKRAHHAEQIRLVEEYLKEHDTRGLGIHIMNLRTATRFTLERMKEGLNTISVTGNVLRDYLTDLFPILEVGTSAKMLSIVPLLAGGGLFETGAGGSAPVLYRQLIEDGHFCWDSLGEFCALGASFEHLAGASGNAKAAVLATTLDQATEKVLDTGKSPGPNLEDVDTRTSHFYLALYWAEALAEQDEDAELKAHFAPVATGLRENEAKIVGEIDAAHGKSADLGGYYAPDAGKLAAVMRPSATFNAILGR